MINEQLKAEIAELRQLKAEQDMEDAIIKAFHDGTLAADPNFAWEDLTVQ